MKRRFAPLALTALGLLAARTAPAQLPRYTLSDQGITLPDIGHPLTLVAVTRNGYATGYYILQTHNEPAGYPPAPVDFTAYIIAAQHGANVHGIAAGIANVPGGPSYTYVTDINDNGNAIGNAASYEYYATAFTPAGNYYAAATALALNEKDQAVGYTADYKYTRTWTADLWTKADGKIVLPVLPGDGQNSAYAISDTGIIVGVSGNGFNQFTMYPPPPPLTQNAFLWKPTTPNGISGTVHALPTLKVGEQSVALGVNDFGDAVGASGSQSVLWPAGGGVVVIPAGAYFINDRQEVGVTGGVWTKNGGVQSVTAQIVHAAGWSGLQITKNYQNGEFAGTGIFNGVPHIFRLTPAPVILSGVVTLEGTTRPAQTVTFTLRPVGGAPTLTITQTLGADGSFALPNVPPDAYSLLVHADGYLQQAIAVTAIANDAAGLAVTLPAGDANGDNVVDIADFGVLVNAYNSSANVSGSGYDTHADFNQDGVVDIADFGLLVNSYGLEGAL